MFLVVALLVLLAFSPRSPDAEDLVEFRDASGAARSLRGVITEESDRAVILSRRDGEFEIPRDRITKIIRRASKRPTGIVNTIRGKIEASAQKQFVQMIEDIKAGMLTDRQIADRADVDLATVTRVRALIAAQQEAA